MNDQNNNSGTENLPAQAMPATGQAMFKRIAAGAALVAIPVAGIGLYLKAEQSSTQKARELEKGFKYDSNSLKDVDPALIKYRAAAKIDSGMKVPRAIAINKAGQLLVAGDRVMKIMNTMGGVVKEIKLADAPVAVCAADDGMILVSLRNRIETYSPEGEKITSWPMASKDAYVTGIAVLGDHVYLADSGQRVVFHTDRAGKVINEIGRADPKRGIDGLILPSPHLEVAIAADGTIWLNNAGRHRMENYSPDGTLERFWGKQGTSIQAFPGCCNPTDFFLLADGSFIISEKGIARVKHYLSDGRFDCVIAAPQSFGPNMLGLGVVMDMSGKVFVLERGAGIIHVFAKSEGSAS